MESSTKGRVKYIYVVVEDEDREYKKKKGSRETDKY
jgi:hypothetical protein